MVKVPWAVACLLCSALLGAAGCAAGNVGNTRIPYEEGVRSDNIVKAGPRIQDAPTTIKEETVLPTAPSVTGGEGVTATDPEEGKIHQKQVPATLTDTRYRLGPEDLVRVSVWENTELTMDLVIRPDGKISMPLIQDVDAEGMTTVELSSLIRERLSAFIRDPQVSIIVLQVNAPKYYIIGNVAKPGTYPLRSEISVLQALALSGGFTQFASPRSIRVIRNIEGVQVVKKINYYKVIDEGGEGNFLLKAGDTIFVP